MAANTPYSGVPSRQERMQRVYKLLSRHDRVERNRIMIACDFPRPQDEPVVAYALFASTIDDLNRALKKQGKGVRCLGGIETGEVYWLTGGTP